MGKLLYFIDLSLILDILGPHESVISWDGYYYEEKAKTIAKWVDGLGCSGPQTYETPMDGQTDFACKVIECLSVFVTLFFSCLPFKA